MATVAYNPIINGLSGMLGKTFVFKTLRNKTIVAAYTRPSKKQSEAQKANRSKFREASNWAQIILKAPEKKAYYQKKAKKLGLPNAYTAAITDYMRSTKVHEITKGEGKVMYSIAKKDFRIIKTEVQVRDEAGDLMETKSVDSNVNGDCIFELPIYPSTYSFTWLITDGADKVSVQVLASQ